MTSRYISLFQASFTFFLEPANNDDANPIYKRCWGEQLTQFQITTASINEVQILQMLDGSGAPLLSTSQRTEQTKEQSNKQATEITLIAPPSTPLSELAISSLTWQEKVLMMRWIASALGKVHSKDIFHLSLRPEIIFISFDKQQALLFDFSCACHCPKGSPGVRSFNQFSANRHFLAPEQGLGIDEVWDNRSDLYALGCVFSWLV